MPAPVLTLALIAAPTAAIDLTAITGGSQDLTDAARRGFNGSDWQAPTGNIYTGVYGQSKINGGGQLAPVFFGGFNNNDVYGATGDGFPNFGQSDGDGIGASTTINGLRVTYDASAGLTRGFDLKPDATRNLHTLYFYGKLDAGLGFTATATVSDASSAAASVTLPSTGAKFGLVCTFRTLHDDAKLNLRFLKTTGSGQIYIAPMYLLPAVKRVGPKSS